MSQDCDPKSGVVYLSTSTGVCRSCRKAIPVRYLADEGRVYLERHCPDHGIGRTLVAESLSWYLEAMQSPVASCQPKKVIPAQSPCPHSCGPCEFHCQACHLPVFSITNACNLRCPICFTFNRADQTYFMSAEEFGRHIDFVIDATGGVDLVNITGGEPTLHPQLFDLLKLAQRKEIGRITLNSNGLMIARNPDMAKRLADEGIYLILSLDTLDPTLSLTLHGKDITADKQQALENLERYGVQTTLLMVLVGGVNQAELPILMNLMLEKSFVRSLTIQTMTYTGQGGGSFLPRQPIPVDSVERSIAEASGGRIQQKHFIPLPTAHPLCYGVCYLATDNHGKIQPFAEILDRQTLLRHLFHGYLLHPSDELESDLKIAIDRVWSEGGNLELLSLMRNLLCQIYPVGQVLSVFERQKRAEQMVKTIYVHAHMDEDNYEVGRAMRCPDQVPVQAQRLIGACNYNLFYRMQDERFWINP